MLFGIAVGAFANGAEPDISGVWRPYSEPGAKGSGSPLPADQPALKEPYASAYKALQHRQTETQKKGGQSTGASVKCKYEGMPTIMAARGALEILQTPGQVTVLGEYMTQTRRIYLDGSLPAMDDLSPGYMGYSAGKWQGNTLEVQTIGVREDVLYRDIPHSAKLKILEKIHLTGPDLLQDEITLIDPDRLTRPYRVTFTYKKDSSHRILEYPCVLPVRGPSRG
jgi:hypothetical protein